MEAILWYIYIHGLSSTKCPLQIFGLHHPIPFYTIPHYNFKFRPKRCSSWYVGWSSFAGKQLAFCTTWKVAGIRRGFPNFIQFPYVFGCFSGTWMEFDQTLWFAGVQFEWLLPYCGMFPAGCQARFGKKALSLIFGICDRIYELNPCVIKIRSGIQWYIDTKQLEYQNNMNTLL